MAKQARKVAGVSTVSSSKAPKKKSAINAIGAETIAPTESPARALMKRLELEHELIPEFTNDRWSNRRSVAFLVVGSSILWVGFYLIATAIF